MEMMTQRNDGRPFDCLRPVATQVDIAPAAAGSVLISMGNTQVICGCTIEEDIPRWMKSQKAAGGWITAEYSMLPYSTEDRARREVASGKVSGRTQEIQRLIGRSLRAVVDLNALGARTAWLDCDVLRADGGTRTASITGSMIALERAIRDLMSKGMLETNPITERCAAVSVGILDGVPRLDLCYEEDAAAEVDFNVVMTESGKFVELQGTAEEHPFTPAQLNQMLALAQKGISELIEIQKEAVLL